MSASMDLYDGYLYTSYSMFSFLPPKNAHDSANHDRRLPLPSQGLTLSEIDSVRQLTTLINTPS